MDRIVLNACVVLLLVNIYSEIVLATSRYDSSLDSIKDKEDNTKVTPLWFGPKQSRRKRILKDDFYKLTEEELSELWDILEESSTAIVTVNGNDKFICKNLQGKPNTLEFVPRLGRNLRDFSGTEKWLRETVNGEVDERSPPFAPRLGRKLSPYSPRLGREA